LSKLHFALAEFVNALLTQAMAGDQPSIGLYERVQYCLEMGFVVIIDEIQAKPELIVALIHVRFGPSTIHTHMRVAVGGQPPHLGQSPKDDGQAHLVRSHDLLKTSVH
jgi:hypothetical protein